MVLIAGEAGIGKTRLVQALAGLAEATGGLVVQARCYEAERSLFLQPLAEAVRAAALALRTARLAAAAGDAAGTLPSWCRSCGNCWTWGRTSAPRPSSSGGGRSRRSPPSSAGWPPASRCCWSSTTCTWPAPRPWSCSTSWPGFLARSFLARTTG